MKNFSKFLKNKTFQKYFLIFLALVAILVWVAVFSRPTTKLEVSFFDVGQGDSIFIKTPDNHKVLIDGGPDNTVLSKLGANLPFYDKKIDLVVLTHPHADHLLGLIEVIKRYEIDTILSTGVVHTTSEYQEWLKLISDAKIPFKIGQFGQVINLGEAKLEILYPFDSLALKKFDNSNESSLVLKLTYGKVTFLFTGDISKEIEEKLISKVNLESNILKVPHHGSKTSLDLRFLEVVNPKIAVISLGENNKYGHPARETLKKLERIKVYRTDQDGTIKIETDGKSYIIFKE